jgi:hypothetical protein
VSFTIGRGVRPGDYRVRLDDVDPVNGSVKSRAEVVFNVPPVISVPLPPEGHPAHRWDPGGLGAGHAGAVRTSARSPHTGLSGGSRPDRSCPCAGRCSAVASGANGFAAANPAGWTAAQRLRSRSRTRCGTPAPSRAPGPTSPGQQVAAAAPAPDIQIGTVVVPEINTALVARGDNLWRISQRIYGRGVRYTVIYGANQPQIRNPNQIYPGQVFVLPGEQEPKSR